METIQVIYMIFTIAFMCILIFWKYIFKNKIESDPSFEDYCFEILLKEDFTHIQTKKEFTIELNEIIKPRLYESYLNNKKIRSMSFTGHEQLLQVLTKRLIRKKHLKLK